MADPEARRATVSASNEGQAPSRARARRGAAVSLAALAIIAAACGGTTATTAPSVAVPSVAGPSVVAPSVAAGGGSVTLGSNASDAVPKAALAAMAASCTASTGVQITINTTDHGKFQDSISSYLQGTPDDIFTWFAGYRMRFFAAQGLSTDISDVWSKIGGDFSAAFKAASTGDDGKQYFVPNYNYPWVVIYRKALWTSKGYQVPKTLDDLIALATKMKGDGITPIAFADKDGWPAMGTFDILNMRTNGYQFHVDLMAGKQKWTDPKVKTVFETWKKLIPFYQSGALGLTWQEAAQAMVAQTAGMYFLGTFAGQQATNPADAADLAFFPFPTLGTAYDAEGGIDAPIDGFMLTKAPKDLAAAKKVMECFGGAAAQAAYIKLDPNDVSANSKVDTSGYNAFQKSSQDIISKSTAIAQFLDRDTRPDFAGPNYMQAYLQKFLTTPDQDLDAFLKNIQTNYDSLPPLQ
jgi:multiple sugar transport system substrate-binding protein